MRSLKELWHGNIEPTECDTSPLQGVQELTGADLQKRKKLKATMPDEQQELFKEYTGCVHKSQTITDCLLFKNSFRHGARMIVEVMYE